MQEVLFTLVDIFIGLYSLFFHKIILFLHMYVLSIQTGGIGAMLENLTKNPMAESFFASMSPN
jgi:hypothetical protein